MLPTERNKVENRHASPLVCRKWAKIFRSSEAAAALWTQLDVCLPPYPDFLNFPLDGLYRWILLHGAHIRGLTLEINGVEGWSPAHALLGMLGPRLASLRIFSDNDDAPAYEPKSRCPWLALVPNVRSLELEGVTDMTIERARLPRGLTHIALNGCGQTGLHKIPKVLSLLPTLHSLSLQFMEPGSDLAGLSSLTNLHHLDLSHCSLREVPAELANLAHLSSLTLNNNEELGGNENADHVSALADLRSLAVLEMRDCGLKSIPIAVTELPNLKTLLLGYNDFTGTTTAIIPPGPYLSSLQLLAMSDSMPDPTSVVDKLVKPLAAATALQTLRINRNWGLSLNTAVTAALIKGKPHFRKLEYSGDMVDDTNKLDVNKLKKIFPLVKFNVVD